MSGYNFTERVRKVLAMSREEAVALHHEYVGTEHILLGLLAEGEGVAAAALTALRADRDAIRRVVMDVVKVGKPGRNIGPDLPYTSRAKKVLELAMTAARELNHSYVGTEHLLLGLLREEKGIAAQVLVDAGVTVDLAREEILRLLGAPESDVSAARHGGAPKAEPLPSPEAGPPPKSQPRIVARARSLPPADWATDRAHAVLDRARLEAANRRSRHIEPEHLLYALLQEFEGMAATLLERLGVDRPALTQAASGAIEETLATDDRLGFEIPWSPQAETALRQAFYEARNVKERRVATDHLLLGLLLTENTAASRVLTEAGFAAHALRAERARIAG
jgi:ATP-dependent Clp protease ATP-binding subunit ClpA